MATMATMATAAVLVAPRQIEIERFPLPPTGDDDGLLRIEATGVCGSDIPPYRGDRPPRALPLILGHEIAGRVERIGASAAERWGVREGDRIIVEEHIPCGHCDLCYGGRHKLCIALRYGSLPTTTAPALWGGYADYAYLHPNAVVYKAPESLPAEQVPLFIPISNGIYWAQKVGGAMIGSTVVIQGPGQHGLGCVIGAREAGAEQIIVTGLTRDAQRLALARELGATHTIMVDEVDVVKRVTEITDGRMADVVLDVTAGATEPVELAPDLAAIGGTIVVAGGKQQAAGLQTNKLFYKELTIRGVWGRDPGSVKVALRLMASGKYPLDRFCTHSFPVEQTAQALDTAARTGGEEAIHVTVVPA